MSERGTDMRFREQAKEFKALQKIFSAAGDFKSMQTATVCAGLAEVCEMFALEVKLRRRRG